MLIKYWANATASGLPLIVIVRSVFPPSRSSQLLMRIMAPDIWRISAILVPPFPIMHPIKSFGTVISCCCVLVCVRFAVVRNCEPASAARAVKKIRRTSLVIDMEIEFRTLMHVQVSSTRFIIDSMSVSLLVWLFLHTKFGNYSYWYLFDSIHQYWLGLHPLDPMQRVQLRDF